MKNKKIDKTNKHTAHIKMNGDHTYIRNVPKENRTKLYSLKYKWGDETAAQMQ